MNILQADGKLADWYRPASYCDTSFLIELEDSFNEYLATFNDWRYGNAESDLVRKYWRKNSNRATGLLGISRRLFEEESLRLVYSPLCTIEYIEAITKAEMFDQDFDSVIYVPIIVTFRRIHTGGAPFSGTAQYRMGFCMG